jgi:hypothetical protein
MSWFPGTHKTAPPTPGEAMIARNRAKACRLARDIIEKEGTVRMGLWIGGMPAGLPEPTLVVKADGTWTLE